MFSLEILLLTFVKNLSSFKNSKLEKLRLMAKVVFAVIVGIWEHLYWAKNCLWFFPSTHYEKHIESPKNPSESVRVRFRGRFCSV